jgi:osmoprotectant transport system permease protein
VAIAGFAGLGFVGFSANRILTPKPMMLWQAAPPLWIGALVTGVALMLSGALHGSRRSAMLEALAGGALLLLADFLAAGNAAYNLVATAGAPAARVSLGGAFWIALGCGALAAGDALQRLRASALVQLAAVGVFVAALAVFATAGWFDDLSIVREWANRREEYASAFGQHVTLVLSALVLALAIGLPLGLAATRGRVASRRIFTILSLIQTIPSIALFGLLIAPLTFVSEAIPGLRAVGVRGIGFTPALIALTLYGLLPIARNVVAALESVPAGVIETARGMGMTRRQVLTRISIPLGLPILLAGVRIVTVQLVGLTVVAALIGAGGFGAFVFTGLGQTATDLVLLGALSAILLALAADALLRVVTLAAIRVATPAAPR